MRPDDYPPEQRRQRQDVARSYSSVEVGVGIVPVVARPFYGLGPAEPNVDQLNADILTRYFFILVVGCICGWYQKR